MLIGNVITTGARYLSSYPELNIITFNGGRTLYYLGQWLSLGKDIYIYILAGKQESIADINTGIADLHDAD